MSSEIMTLSTTLEIRPDIPVKEVLQEKCNAVGAERTADYVAYAVDNITDKIKRIDDAIAELKAIKEAEKGNIERIKEGTAEWLEENGIDKLSGDRISSISVKTGRTKEELVINDEEYFKFDPKYTKVVLDKTAIKSFVKASPLNLESIAEVKTIHLGDTVLINKKRSA